MRKVLSTALLAAVALAISPTAAHAATSISVSPSTGLNGGDVVTVSFSGYPANVSNLVGLQCGTFPITTSPADCTTATVVTGITSDATGAGSFQITITEGTIGSNAHPCDATHQCFILLANPQSAADLTAAPIQFAGPTAVASPNTGLVNGQVVQVSMSGFTPDTDHVAGQCITQTPTSGTDCNTSNLVLGIHTDSAGEATFSFTVTAGAVGSGTCDSTHDCYITVRDLNNINRAAAVLSFASVSPGTTVPPATTTTTTMSTTSTTAAPSGAVQSTGSSRGSGGLARTGVEVPMYIGIAFAAIALGSAALRVNRRVVSQSERHQ